MVLSDLCLQVLKYNMSLQRAIRERLDVSQVTLSRFIRENRPDGRLTTIGVVNLIIEWTGLTEEQIIKAEKVEA